MTASSPPIWGRSTVRAENTALRQALSAIGATSGRLLEPGCGAGRFVRTLKQLRPDIEAHGCDISREAIQLAEASEDGVTYAIGSLSHLPYHDGKFDIVVVMDVLEHLQDAGAGIAELGRVMRPGGLLHALVPCEGQPWTLHWAMWKLNIAADLKVRHGHHVQRFTRSDVRHLISDSGFVIHHISYSMHALGQARDVLTYLRQEAWFQRAKLDNFAFTRLLQVLWGLAYVESRLLASVPLYSVAQHITATRE
ncbi:MAG: class I SAM-dependent methyltransferase [Dehalococcoidia bacterium]|nr:class I SAM-dependent methyltransferase [Dehalococcoidia bacterium]